MPGDVNKRNPHAETAAMREREEYHPPGWRETVEERTEYEPTPDYPTEQEISTVPTAEEIEPPPPLEVAVVSTSEGREDVLWAAGRFHITSDRVTQLVGNDKTRRRAIFTNHDDANAVFLMHNSTLETWMGYQLSAGATVEMLHNHSVYAKAASPNEVDVSVISEFIREDDD
jgi:hypothetical protein